jgi:glyoxylase-like metal-dependent hydrolase (beta-lactamase superfamily II)
MRGLALCITAGLAALMAAGSALAQQGFGEPRLSEANLKQVSPHVWVIMGFPNVGFVVGDKAVLVVDTGLGAENGALVASVAQKLGGHGQKLILTTTHFHPEHATGQGGFPPGTEVIRNRVQQQELDQEGQRMIDMFAARGGGMAELLVGAKPMKATVLFDRETALDLGGVHARLYWFGAAHTRGDEITYVPEDSLILPGDVVQNRISPNIICASCSPRQWVAVLDHVAELKPVRVVPDHGDLGDGALVAQERGFLVSLDRRAQAAKAAGEPVDQAGKRIQGEMEQAYPGWTGLGNVPQSVQRAYADPDG